jgi:hypothetical protein
MGFLTIVLAIKEKQTMNKLTTLSAFPFSRASIGFNTIFDELGKITEAQMTSG